MFRLFSGKAPKLWALPLCTKGKKLLSLIILSSDVYLSLSGIWASCTGFHQKFVPYTDLVFSNMTQLLDIVFSVFNNWDPDEGERRRATITAVKIGNALNIPKSYKGKPKGQSRKNSCFKCQKTRHWAQDCMKLLPGSWSKCQVADVPDSWHWRIDCLCSEIEARVAKTLLL